MLNERTFHFIILEEFMHAESHCLEDLKMDLLACPFLVDPEHSGDNESLQLDIVRIGTLLGDEEIHHALSPLFRCDAMV